jgi:hypothetical protein
VKLYDNWRDILRQSWSLRFIIVAGLLSGCEIALPLIGDRFTPGVFAGLSFAFTAAAFIARLVAQKGI